MGKRLRGLMVCFSVILGLLACRLAYIQLAGHGELTAAAEKQQEITLEGADSRGVIFDRNGTPIAGANREFIYIIKNNDCDGETLNALKQVEAEEIPGDNGGYRVFSSEMYDENTGERLINNSDAYIMLTNRRYEKEQPAVHMIGYVNPKDKSGASGIELMYDEELSAYERKVSAAADVKGNLLQGYGLNVTNSADKDDYVKEGITITLDLGIQKKAEELLAGAGRPGAVVVTKCSTGEIIAAASSPVFDPAEIEKYMESSTGELINKVTQGEYPPGSVFKLVVAAAALEKGYDTGKHFMCKGKVSINGHEVACNTGGEKGHGKITLEEAMAYSCNCAFVRLAEEIGPGPVIKMAGKLGLGSNVLEDFPGEKSGSLMTVQQAGGAAIANLGIGQGETLVTPLQIARLVSIIANNGKDTGLFLVREDGEIPGTEQCISKKTALQLQKMMNSTAEYGTAKELGTAVRVGAKTGSAESVLGGVPVIHGWITGYVPAGSPEYTITVFMEDGRSGRKSAGPVFAEIAEYISSRNLFEKEVGF